MAGRDTRSRSSRAQGSARSRSDGFGASNSKRSDAAERFVSRGSNRVFWVIVIFLLMAITFFVRLVYLQIIVADEYSAQAREARTVGFAIEPRRGTIYDRNGNILAISVDATTVYANPSEIETPGATSRVIAEVLGGTPADYIDSLAVGSDVTFSFVARKVDVDKAAKLAEQELPGIYFIPDTRREYPYGQVGGQVVGAVNIAIDEKNNLEYYEGVAGLEMYYNQILSGTPGYYEAEVGSDGTPIPGGVHVSKPAVEGQDIVISIDIEFQEEVEKDLQKALKEVGTESGCAVVMDAATGEIYAAASLPYFNPANRTVVKEGSMQLKAVSNLFEPGSIFKTVSAMAILENEAMAPDDEIVCPPELYADGYIVSDAYDRDEVTWSLRTIIAMSSNVGISLAVEKMGFDKLYDAIMRYNLNTPTGVDYPGEQGGYLIDFDYWSRVQGYNVSFGQGISVNAMQMVRFFGCLINNGYEVVPHFLIRKPQTGEVIQYEQVEVIQNKDALPQVLDMLRAVVTEGTGTKADIEGYEVAGKTSTAEIFDDVNGGYRVGVYNLAFTGFILNSNSTFVCFIGADEVRGDRSVTFGFQAIMSHAIDRYNITPK